MQEEENNKNSNMGKLLNPAINSTAILCIILIIGVLAPIIKQFPFIYAIKDISRGISYSVLVILTIWQLWTIILTLVPADMIKRKSDIEYVIQQQKNDFFSMTQRHNK